MSEEFKPEMAEGLWAPEYCPRGKDDCSSLCQIIAKGHASFMCVGENDPDSREMPQDRFRVCFKNGHVDDMQDYDKRDLMQTNAVLAGALAIIAEREDNESHD